MNAKALCLTTTMVCFCLLPHGQAQPLERNQPRYALIGVESESSPAIQRRQVMESERWRKLEILFQEWLSVQCIYSPAEVAQLKARWRSRVASTSRQQLEEFVRDMEDKLTLLLSDEATERSRGT